MVRKATLQPVQTPALGRPHIVSILRLDLAVQPEGALQHSPGRVVIGVMHVDGGESTYYRFQCS
jgi:hypothetical protein